MNIITSLIFHIQPGLTLLFVLIQLGQDLSHHELILMLLLLHQAFLEGCYCHFVPEFGATATVSVPPIWLS